MRRLGRSISNGVWRGHFLALPLGRRGQATTEVVLLFPIFMFFLFAFAKIFALLILMQKLEIASFYAARRWQLESHRNAAHEAWDEGTLRMNIETRVLAYLGYGGPAQTMDWGGGKTSQSSASGFLGLTMSCRQTANCPSKPGITVQRTQVWNVVTVTACTKPLQMPFYKTTGFVVCSDRKSTRLNSSHIQKSRMPSSA